MEFKTFVNAFVRLPCQIIRTSRRLVYRLLSWNPWQPVFFRMLDVWRCWRRNLEVGVRTLRPAAAT
ncbi:hypothetical protein AYO40_05005 [Planctomycetaceae bacterium SCGC AG-212-D15]|nr:hypothetical protein AYO40_05005 [Planctomycetaceae bacterium SCGC AG-212-D15]